MVETMAKSAEAAGAAANPTVLIVDDSRLARMRARKALEESGVSARVVEAGCAAEALDVWAVEAPAFAIVDLNMPGDDGLAMCAAVLEKQPGARLVLCTANQQQAVSSRAEALGVPLINKPMTSDKLQPVISAWVGS